MNSRLKTLQKKVNRRKLDGFLVTHLKNIQYLVGFSGSNGILFVHPKSSKGNILLTDFRYKEQVKEEIRECEVKIVSGSLWMALSKKIKGFKRLGFETYHISHFAFEKLEKVFPKSELVPTENWVEEIRMVKDKDEIDLIKKSQAITDEVFQEILPFIKPGRRERDIAAEVEYLMRRKGASGTSFDTICASGKRAALPHARAGSKVIRNGDFVTLDMGAIYEGYCSDMTRTVVVGKATPSQKKIYRLVLKAQEAGVRSCKPSRRCSEVDKRTRRIIEKEGYGKAFGHGTGHGVGLEVHELPGLYSRSNEILKRKMVVTVEPGIYLPGKWGVRIEDMILIQNGGYENLSKSPKELIEL
jgi:Xaa-Pro aminopeptidase